MYRRTLITAAASISMPGLVSKVFAADAGVGDREIVIGQSAVLSGPLGGAMHEFNAGAQLAFNLVNAQGGIHKRHIRYISLDDELKPDKTVANYKALLTEHHAFAFFGGIGSANTAAAVPIFQESNTALIGSNGVSDSAREKAAGVAYFVRAGYGREAERLVQHLTSIGITQISVAHIAVPGGLEVLAAVRSAIKARNPSWDVVRAVGVKADGSDAVEAGKAIGGSGSQSTIMFLSGAPVAEMIKSVQETDGKPTFYGMSVVAGDQVAKAVGPRLRGLTISQVIPYPWSETDATARQFRERVAVQKGKVSYFSYEGYINALVLIEALRRTGQSLTRANLHATMGTFKSRIGGMDVDFTAGGVAGSRFVELVHATPEGRYLR